MTRTPQELQIYLETLLSASVAEAKLQKISELLKNQLPGARTVTIDSLVAILDS